MCPPVFDRDVLALDVTGVTQAAVKSRENLACQFGRCKVEKPNHRHFWLLRPRREWAGCCTTEKGDELPPLHSMHSQLEETRIKISGLMAPCMQRRTKRIATGRRGLLDTPRVHHPTSAAERHLALQPVDRTGTQAYKPGGLAYSSALGELLAGSLHLIGFSTRATEIAADDARLAGELLPARNLCLDGREPCLDALTDHRALEFAKRSCDLEEQLASGRGRVEVLLLQIEIR